MNKKIRIVHYGIGHDHSPQFLACIKQYPEIFEIVGVCEPNPKMWDKFDEFDVYKDVPRLPRKKSSLLTILTQLLWRLMTLIL